ncbi:MAG: hypothetical protein WB696_28040 [Chthoniobacterales bacterium]
MECNSEDFNAVNRWRFPELAPSDLLRSLHCDLSDVDHAEFVRAKWMWTRKPKSVLEDGLFGYAVVVFIGVVLLLIPHVGVLLALICCLAVLLVADKVLDKHAARLGRWRQEYESSIGRVIRSRRRGK